MNVKRNGRATDRENNRSLTLQKKRYSNDKDMKKFLNSKSWESHELLEHKLSLAVFQLEEKLGHLKKRFADVTKTSLATWRNYK